MSSQYNYQEILTWLEQKAKQDYGSNFHFVEEDKVNITKLVAYFLKDEITANQFGLDLSKGILLTGPVGSGKTTLMTIMKYITQKENKFYMRTCRDVSFEFIKEGYEIIHKYSRGSYPQTDCKNYCFDDLGVESNLKYYGNECNVMAEIILSRYDLFISKKVITHITTNLSASEIETMYGNRVRSRLRAMLNLIAFDKSTQDKR
ncbi:ATPase [Flavobacterium sp. NRK F10]|uniref:AAA family ATPase n=1 Tax=Flavobacterium sp. NRK F10 TaxID=2954931 RepID=UPI00209186BE|nr:AAA family ATPase [Flavobacterium sp. NRK F10]MCO6175877.1 ATPase [Flavobacterium sp. NRK F10]